MEHEREKTEEEKEVYLKGNFLFTEELRKTEQKAETNVGARKKLKHNASACFKMEWNTSLRYEMKWNNIRDVFRTVKPRAVVRFALKFNLQFDNQTETKVQATHSRPLVRHNVSIVWISNLKDYRVDNWYAELISELFNLC